VTVKRALLAFGLAFLIALPLTFPASLISRLVSLPEGIAHAPLSGSLFKVHTDWVQVSGIRLKGVSASPSLAGLFAGTPLALQVSAPVAAEGRLGGSGIGLKLSAVDARSQFESLRPLLGLPGLGIDASIAVDIDTAKLLDGRCAELAGELILSALEGQGLPELSDIRGTLSCDKGNLLISVAPDNTLRLSGTATLTPQGRADVDMTAEPPPGPLFELFVDFLGPPRDGKRFQIRFRS